MENVQGINEPFSDGGAPKETPKDREMRRGADVDPDKPTTNADGEMLNALYLSVIEDAYANGNGYEDALAALIGQLRLGKKEAENLIDVAIEKFKNDPNADPRALDKVFPEFDPFEPDDEPTTNAPEIGALDSPRKNRKEPPNVAPDEPTTNAPKKESKKKSQEKASEKETPRAPREQTERPTTNAPEPEDSWDVSFNPFEDEQTPRAPREQIERPTTNAPEPVAEETPSEFFEDGIFDLDTYLNDDLNDPRLNLEDPPKDGERNFQRDDQKREFPKNDDPNELFDDGFLVRNDRRPLYGDDDWRILEEARQEGKINKQVERERERRKRKWEKQKKREEKRKKREEKQKKRFFDTPDAPETNAPSFEDADADVNSGQQNDETPETTEPRKQNPNVAPDEPTTNAPNSPYDVYKLILADAYKRGGGRVDAVHALRINFGLSEAEANAAADRYERETGIGGGGSGNTGGGGGSGNTGGGGGSGNTGGGGKHKKRGFGWGGYGFGKRGFRRRVRGILKAGGSQGLKLAGIIAALRQIVGAIKATVAKTQELGKFNGGLGALNAWWQGQEFRRKQEFAADTAEDRTKLVNEWSELLDETRGLRTAFARLGIALQRGAVHLMRLENSAIATAKALWGMAGEKKERKASEARVESTETELETVATGNLARKYWETGEIDDHALELSKYKGRSKEDVKKELDKAENRRELESAVAFRDSFRSGADADEEESYFTGYQTLDAQPTRKTDLNPLLGELKEIRKAQERAADATEKAAKSAEKTAKNTEKEAKPENMLTAGAIFGAMTSTAQKFAPTEQQRATLAKTDDGAGQWGGAKQYGRFAAGADEETRRNENRLD